MNKLNKDLVKEMSSLMDELCLSEFEYSDSKTKIKLSKKIIISKKSSENEFQNIESKTSESKTIIDEKSIKSPLVGTVYLSPEPGSKTFVEIGQTVKIGQVILIIEAMKTMNEITSHKTGVVKKIFVRNADPVEFGEPLVLIE